MTVLTRGIAILHDVTRLLSQRSRRYVGTNTQMLCVYSIWTDNSFLPPLYYCWVMWGDLNLVWGGGDEVRAILAFSKQDCSEMWHVCIYYHNHCGQVALVYFCVSVNLRLTVQLSSGHLG